MDKHELGLLGWNEFFDEQLTENEYINCYPARVISQHGNMYTIMSAEGNHTARITGKFRFKVKQIKDYPIVGDFVIAGNAENSKNTLIYKVLTRKNYFSRKMPISGGRKLKNGAIDGGITEEQIIASNIDTVFVMCSLDNNFSIPRIERYLTLVKHQNLSAVILLNKVDLCQSPEEYISKTIDIANGIPVLGISVITKEGLEGLNNYLAYGKTIAFIGSSGVGKSSLLNALVDNQVQIVNSTSEHSGKGKHTTTHRQLFFHPSGYMIIDTPGMKELQLWADEEDLNSIYQDVKEIISHCKYKNCTHKNEQDCAIKMKIESGELSKERYERYLGSLKELKRLDEKKKEYEQRLKKRGSY